MNGKKVFTLCCAKDQGLHSDQYLINSCHNSSQIFFFFKHIFVTKFLDLFILLSATSVYLAYVLIGASESLSSHLAD